MSIPALSSVGDADGHEGLREGQRSVHRLLRGRQELPRAVSVRRVRLTHGRQGDDGGCGHGRGCRGRGESFDPSQWTLNKMCGL